MGWCAVEVVGGTVGGDLLRTGKSNAAWNVTVRYILSAVNRRVASVRAAFMIHRTIRGPTSDPL